MLRALLPFLLCICIGGCQKDFKLADYTGEYQVSGSYVSTFIFKDTSYAISNQTLLIEADGDGLRCGNKHFCEVLSDRNSAIFTYHYPMYTEDTLWFIGGNPKFIYAKFYYHHHHAGNIVTILEGFKMQ